MLIVAGCEHRPDVVNPTDAPVVSVSLPVEKDVTDHVDFTGRTEAVSTTDIRPRVTGYLVKMPFKEGTEVKAGDVLFEIDPRPYQAQLDRAQGEVVLAEARLKLAKADNARAKGIAKMNPGAISQQDLDKYQAAEEEADASVKASKANLESYKINLDFTKVLSPIDGVVSRYYLTLGNLVNQDQTVLTTVVSEDPIYVYFDVDERTMLRILRLILAKKLDPAPVDKNDPLLLGLADEEGFPHTGWLDFANNKVDPFTGTIMVRGVFPNPKGASRALLRPGMFVRIRLPLGKPHPAILLTERAVGSDQDQKFVYAINPQDEVERRNVQLGDLQDGLREVQEGLKPGERIVVSALQRVKPGLKVRPKVIDMPLPPKAQPGK